MNSRINIDFIYHHIVSDLKEKAHKLLGIQLSSASSGLDSFLGSRFIWLDRMHHEGDQIGRDIEILKLQFLFKHLEEIRDNHRAAHQRARKLLRRAKREDQYFGARMEVYCAASLIRAAVNFKCRESPDYQLEGDFSGLFIECGSAHIAGSGTDLIKKLSLSVLNKCKKPYADRNTILMLDVTNIMFHAARLDAEWTTDEVRSAVSAVIDESGYGGVLLMSYGISKDANRIISNFIRVDGSHASTRLKKFLDAVYPRANSAEQPHYSTSQS